MHLGLVSQKKLLQNVDTAIQLWLFKAKFSLMAIEFGCLVQHPLGGCFILGMLSTHKSIESVVTDGAQQL